MGIELERYESSLEAIKIALENEEIDTNGTNFRYIDKLGENTLSDAFFDVELENKEDNIINKDNIENKDNIINPNTFRDNYYLVIGILIVGLICFIQMKSKAKRKL